MRAVLDPNVLISALLAPRGAPAQIVVGWLAGEFELVVSTLLLAELEQALAYPKVRQRLARADAEELLGLLRDAALVGLDPPTPPRRSPNPGDDYLLALAESENALLVSGDQHLLAVADRFPIRAPRAFLDALEEQR